jgi:type IV pilus assembly protein PilE
MAMKLFKRLAGFSLLELMITVTIIGILASIAYPSYTEYVIRAKRSDGKAALLKTQLAEEKWRANHTTYGDLADIGISSSSEEGYYTISISGTPTATTYTIIATPTFTDTKCGTLGIIQSLVTETKTTTGTDTVTNCWTK